MSIQLTRRVEQLEALTATQRQQIESLERRLKELENAKRRPAQAA